MTFICTKNNEKMTFMCSSSLKNSSQRIGSSRQILDVVVFFVEQTVFFVEQFFNKYVLQKNKKRQKNDKSSFFLEKYRYSQDERLETLLLRPVPRPIFQKIWLFSHQFFTSDALELVFRRFRPFLKF